MELATTKDAEKIVDLYAKVINHVNTTDIKLGWNIDVYPNEEFVVNAINNSEMCILREGEEIIAAAVVNHNVNPEYDDIDWKVKGPKEKIATIHALAVSPDKRGSSVSFAFLSELEKLCKNQGDLAIHLDVIDTNIPAYKLYQRSKYEEIACIKMYYEVVGTREFWMMEKLL